MREQLHFSSRRTWSPARHRRPPLARLFDLFLALDQPGNPTGSVVLNFNDAGIEPGLAFSSDSPQHVLIPDPDFLQTRGYAKERDYFARNLTPWGQRSAAVF